MGNISNPGANVANYNHGADWNGLDGNLTTVGSAGPLSTSHYGTFDQVGNVWEWTQTGDDFAQILSGGEWNSSDAWQLGDVGIGGRAGDSLSVGFRVATVPEPSTFALGILGLMACARRRRLSLRS
jgi:formylglycine-generating enzyme required for sulfatase activity